MIFAGTGATRGRAFALGSKSRLRSIGTRALFISVTLLIRNGISNTPASTFATITSRPGTLRSSPAFFINA